MYLSTTEIFFQLKSLSSSNNLLFWMFHPNKQILPQPNKKMNIHHGSYDYHRHSQAQNVFHLHISQRIYHENYDRNQLYTSNRHWNFDIFHNYLCMVCITWYHATCKCLKDNTNNLFHSKNHSHIYLYIFCRYLEHNLVYIHTLGLKDSLPCWESHNYQ